MTLKKGRLPQKWRQPQKMMGALDSVPKQRFWLLVHFYHKVNIKCKVLHYIAKVSLKMHFQCKVHLQFSAKHNFITKFTLSAKFTLCFRHCCAILTLSAECTNSSARCTLSVK